MSRQPRTGKKTNLSQFGLIDIPDVNDDDEPLDLSDDDFDLEAELAAISGGGGQKPRPRKPAPAPAANLDAMIAESLKDVPSDDEGSGDDDDPDLLNELQELGIDDDDEAPSPPARTSRPAPPPPGASLSTDSSTISMLQDRITNYTVAEKNAKTNGESSRARRCVNLLEGIFSKSILFNSLSSSVIICVTGFNVLVVDNIVMMASFTAFLVFGLIQIFLYCYYGDTIRTSSMQVSDAIYNSNWYNIGASERKGFLIVIIRAQRPCELTANGFFKINLNAFTSILSRSWSFFALLKTMYHPE